MLKAKYYDYKNWMKDKKELVKHKTWVRVETGMWMVTCPCEQWVLTRSLVNRQKSWMSQLTSSIPNHHLHFQWNHLIFTLNKDIFLFFYEWIRTTISNVIIIYLYSSKITSLVFDQKLVKKFAFCCGFERNVLIWWHDYP